jgi:hypothetical protein
VGGYDTVAVIFVREVSDPLTSLVKAIDKQLADTPPRPKGENKLGVFVVFCTDDPEMPKQLEKLIEAEDLQHVILCTFAASGPTRYKIAAEASFTVLVYTDRTVQANFALRKGELDRNMDKEIRKAVAQVLPKE